MCIIYNRPFEFFLKIKVNSPDNKTKLQPKIKFHMKVNKQVHYNQMDELVKINKRTKNNYGTVVYCGKLNL
jgi:hypothetical protein